MPPAPGAAGSVLTVSADARATAKLGPAERTAALAELARTEQEVLVVGGGIVGAGDGARPHECGKRRGRGVKHFEVGMECRKMPRDVATKIGSKPVGCPVDF